MANGQEFDPGRQLRLMQASFLQGAVSLVLHAITVGLVAWVGQKDPVWGVSIGITGLLLSALIAALIKVANQCVVLCFGLVNLNRSEDLDCFTLYPFSIECDLWTRV